jgi:hypothetical protein
MAAKKQSIGTSVSKFKEDKNDIKRKGIHSKKNTSSLKTSKNYVKTYRGQGR